MTAKSKTSSTFVKPAVVVASDAASTGDATDVSPAVRSAFLALWSVLFAPSTHAAWVRRSYVMVRGDKGTGRAMTNVSWADGSDAGGTWVTVCEHGNAAVTNKGASAEHAGQTRRSWCAACAAGAAPTVAGLPGALPSALPGGVLRPADKPKRTRKGKPAAPAETPAPAVDSDAPAGDAA